MEQKLPVFSEDSMKLIKGMVEDYLRRNRSKYPLDHFEEPRDTIFAPEVYIAEVPVGGIPALTKSRPDEDTGSGTSYVCRYIPGSASCNIYKIQVSYTAETGTGTGYTEVIELVNAEFDKTVYNVSTTAISGPSATTGTATATGTSTASCDKIFVVVKRDKYGRWLAEQSGGTGHTVIRFSITSVGPFESETSAYCLSVRAEVLDISCGATDVSVGDSVIVWDPSGCYFSVPSEILINMYGTAVKMTWDASSVVATECIDEFGEFSLDGECWWLVQGLCCAEEVYY